VSGAYPNVMNFIKDLESSDTVFIIDAVAVRSTPTGGPSEVTMDVDLETFFYQ
jgi:hypothetical protein